MGKSKKSAAPKVPKPRKPRIKPPSTKKPRTAGKSRSKVSGAGLSALTSTLPKPLKPPKLGG